MLTVWGRDYSHKKITRPGFCLLMGFCSCLIPFRGICLMTSLPTLSRYSVFVAVCCWVLPCLCRLFVFLPSFYLVSAGLFPKTYWQGINNWNLHGDLPLEPLESKIKSIGSENLNAAAKFDNLDKVIKEMCKGDLTILKNLHEVVIPGVERLARELQSDNLIILESGNDQKLLELTKQQIAQILANSFFCNFKSNHKLPHTNFDKLFSCDGIGFQRSKPNREKLKCLLAYFSTVIREPRAINGCVTFERICVDGAILTNGPFLDAHPLTEIAIELKENMSECPPNVAQVNFSGRYVGGGVFYNECRQEEIRFVTCPELIAALFIAEPLEDNEALLITGAKPYSTCKGFGQDFEYVGEADLKAPCSDVVIAIDATDFSSISDRRAHYTPHYINREILKAYAGFVKCPRQIIATGNWGCGAFQGDPLLKMMIQWIAAAMTKKKLIYYCFGDVKLANEIALVMQKYYSQSAGELYAQLLTIPENRGFEATAISSFLSFKNWVLGEQSRAGHIKPARVTATAKNAPTVSAANASLVADNAKPADEFDFIRHAARRDNFELVRAYSVVTAKPTAATFIKLIEVHAGDSFGNSLYNILTEIEMNQVSSDTLYDASCIFECASDIRNKGVERELLAACKTFQEEKKCILTRRQIACVLANMFLCTFHSISPDQPNISLITFFKLCSKRDDNYKNKLLSFLAYFWEIKKMRNTNNDCDEVTFSLQTLEQSVLPIKERYLIFPGEGTLFTVCQTRQVIGGSALEPLDLGEEERIFLAHPEMIAARIFFHAPLKDNEALLIQNVKNTNMEILRETFYEKYKSCKNGAFALVKEGSVQISSKQQ